MFGHEEERERPFLPEDEARCVWMDAGVISYKICDRGLDCERCPLDRALRGEDRGPRAGEELEPGSPLLDRLTRLDVDTRCFYHPGHTWILAERADCVRVGLDAMVASLLGTIDAVTLQRPGGEVTRGASFGEITQGGHCFPLISPVSGRVRAVNAQALSFPAAVTVDPLGEGWLAAVEPEDLDRDLAFCRKGKAVLAWYLQGMEWVNGFISPALADSAERLGPTLYDGGDLSGDLKDWVAPERYRRLILRLLGDGEEWLPEP